MKVIAAMSGGVDSAVAALRLKQEGYDVIGITIKTWPARDCGLSGEKLCCSLDAVQFARSAAEDIDIPHYVVDLSREFAETVKDYFVGEYSRGRTPNPCIYCNSAIKFGHLFFKARELGAEMIATGHYARVLKKGSVSMLAEADDKHRDQSYFLFHIERGVLPHIIFPLGGMDKDQVRQMAEENALMSASRRSSQDICFGSGGDYREYLAGEGIKEASPGDIMDVKGRVIGTHEGIASYTVGQRHGLGLGLHYPVYVIGIDQKKNTITVGSREQAMRSKIRVRNFNWLTMDVLDRSMCFDTRIRYNGKKARSRIIPTGDNEAVIEFDEPQFAPTPGQAAVFYDGSIVAGGAWIEDVLDGPGQK
jgi:tRNA-uridine 2-sulfurtransferase